MAGDEHQPTEWEKQWLAPDSLANKAGHSQKVGKCLSCGKTMAWGTPVCPSCGKTLTWYEDGQVPQAPAEPSMAVRIAQGKVASGKRLKSEDQLALMAYEKSQGRKVSGLAMTAATITTVYKVGCALVFLIIMGIVLYACFTAH